MDRRARRELLAATRLTTSLDAIDSVIGEALEALGQVVPYDLATVMQLEGEELSVRVARGALGDRDDVQEHRLRLGDFPSLERVLEEGQVRAFTESDHGGGDGDPFDGVLDLPHGHFCMVAPLRDAAGPLGIVTLDRETCGIFEQSAVDLVGVFARLLGLAINYGEQSVQLQRVREQLLEQNRILVEQSGDSDAAEMINSCASSAMKHVAYLGQQVAITDTPVLILGETGVGKDVLANAIHQWSPRAHRPMVRVNCAALPASLIESELFGHVKGAFSGATARRIGRFQAADGGTLFLDEIGEIPLDTQVKLLRVLQEGTFEPVGSDTTTRVDVRVIAATNRDLRAAIQSGEFREDLYYRLAVFPIVLPPLRLRSEDIAVIARSFLDRHARRTGRGPWLLDDRAIAELERGDWPGNIRELVNTLERATILGRGPRLIFAPTVATSPIREPREMPRLESLRDAECKHIARALEVSAGKVYGPGGAAELLDINPSTLVSRMQKHGLGGARGRKNR